MQVLDAGITRGAPLAPARWSRELPPRWETKSRSQRIVVAVDRWAGPKETPPPRCRHRAGEFRSPRWPAKPPQFDTACFRQAEFAAKLVDAMRPPDHYSISPLPSVAHALATYPLPRAPSFSEVDQVDHCVRWRGDASQVILRSSPACRWCRVALVFEPRWLIVYASQAHFVEVVHVLRALRFPSLASIVTNLISPVNLNGSL